MVFASYSWPSVVDVDVEGAVLPSGLDSDVGEITLELDPDPRRSGVVHFYREPRRRCCRLELDFAGSIAEDDDPTGRGDRAQTPLLR